MEGVDVNETKSDELGDSRDDEWWMDVASCCGGRVAQRVVAAMRALAHATADGVASDDGHATIDEIRAAAARHGIKVDGKYDLWIFLSSLVSLRLATVVSGDETPPNVRRWRPVSRKRRSVMLELDGMADQFHATYEEADRAVERMRHSFGETIMSDVDELRKSIGRISARLRDVEAIALRLKRNDLMRENGG